MAFIDEGVRTFPAPLEVDRYLYVEEFESLIDELYPFPAPREVDRYLYEN